MAVTRKRKRAYHHGDLRAALIAAAAELLSEGKAISLTEAAARAGVSAAAPYRHFADKEALLAAVAEAGFRKLREALVEAAGSRKGVERIAAVGAAYVRFGRDEPAAFRLMFSSDVDKLRHPQLLEAAFAALGTVLSVVSEAQGAGELPGDDPSAVAVPLWGLAHGLAMLQASGTLQMSGLAAHAADGGMAAFTMLMRGAVAPITS
jgi:AcrR family transcriptional regulator